MTEFDPAHRLFVSYIDKSREYYLARGYNNPYRWARFTDVPFAPLAKPLRESRVALVTTASLPGESQREKIVFAAPGEPPPSALYTEHRSWHKTATHTRDVETFLPICRLAEFAAEGRVGSPSPRFYGVPTDYSQHRTLDAYAPEALALCRADAVDGALFFPL
jgi:hypothetical protein